MVKNYVFLIHIILNVSTKLAITGSLSRLLQCLLFLPSQNVFFLTNWMYPFIVTLSFILLLVSKKNSASYENIRCLIVLLLKYLHSVKPRIHLISVLLDCPLNIALTRVNSSA